MSATEQLSVSLRPPSQIWDEYLATVPCAHAVFRASELSALSGRPLDNPSLEVGCGSGQFAALAVDGRIDIGVDVCPTQLRHAEQSGCYGQLIRADACRLPFFSSSFQTVLAISTLEHIVSPEYAVAEAFRVLNPGGRFLATIVLNDLHDFLFLPRFLKRLGLSTLAQTYIRCHDRLFRHRTLLSEQEWRDIFIRQGFEIEWSRFAVGPELTAWWDLLLLTAWPYRLGQALGWSFVWHPRWFRRWIMERFRPLLERQESRGSVWVVVARKPLHAECADGPSTVPQPELSALGVS
jgi:SAM-dependent methyltransferase